MTILECANLWDCLSSLILGGCSLALVGAFIIGGSRLLAQPANRPGLGDLVIFGLSAVQSFFFAFFYLLTDRSSVLVLFLRSMKSFQILLISGLLIMMQGQVIGSAGLISRKWESLFPWSVLGIVATFILAAIFEPTNPHCRDYSWLLISISQISLLGFLAQVSYSLVAKATSPKHGAEPSVLGNMSESSNLRLPNISVEMQPAEIRSVWLLAMLVGVEGVSSLINLVWDVVFIAVLQRQKLDSCHSIDFGTPAEFVESCLFLMSEIATSIAPQAAVFYVFYWHSRRSYYSFQQDWDLDLPA